MRLTLYALALVLLGRSAPASAAVPTIYNLGTLGGTNSYGYAINANGQVAGYSSLAGDASRHAFIYTGTPGSGGMMADLGTLLGATDSYGRAINASGQVAGYSYSLSGEALYHAFLYTGTPGSGGAMVDLGTLDGGGLGSSGAYGVNDGGQVVGFSTAGMENDHAFLTGTPGSGGAMADLGTLGESYMFSGASGINAGGQVTGYSETVAVAGEREHAFLYTGTPGSGGAMADLGTLPGKTYSQGLAINDVGQVVGSSGNSWSDTTQHAFLYTGTPGSGGAMADLGTLGGTESYGRAINTKGQVAGDSKTTGGAQHAFLYTGTPGVDGHMIDLDAWLDANNPKEGAKWTLLRANGLTDTGLITGQGDYNDGHGGLSDGPRAFLLDASALVPALPGDFNHDGKVDAADYVVWRKGLGGTYAQSNYNTWHCFGQTAGSSAALPSAELLSAAVPEPAALALFGVGLAVTFGALSQRSKSRRARHRANHRQAVRRPRVEPLEDRYLLSFSPASFSETSPPVVWVPPPPLVADFTSDGILDKISSNSHEVVVRPGRGDGTFGDPIRTSIQPTPGAPLLAVADFNGDNRRDVFTAAAIDFESPPTVNVLLGQGDGGFVLVETFSVGTVPTMIGTGEIFGTGRTDVAIAGYDYLSGEHGVLALFNDGHWWTPSPPSPDYNGNGTVDAADYVVWRKTLGSSVPNFSATDGNGNGLVDQDDHAVWRAHFGEVLPAVGAGSFVAAANADTRKLSASLDSVVATQQTSARVEPTEHEQRGSIRPPGTSERDVALSLIDARLPRFFPQTKAAMRSLHALPTTKSDMKTRGNDLLLVRSAAAQFDQHASERGHDSRLINGSVEEAVETRLEPLEIAFTTLGRVRRTIAGRIAKEGTDSRIPKLNEA